MHKQRYFDPNYLKEPLGLNVNLWKGFFISVRPSESGLTINLNCKPFIPFNGL